MRRFLAALGMTGFAALGMTSFAALGVTISFVIPRSASDEESHPALGGRFLAALGMTGSYVCHLRFAICEGR